MKDNNLYNLMTQMTQESKSHWRITKEYQKLAKSKELKAFWVKLAKQKEEDIKEMALLLKGMVK
jgi:acyl-CoA thioesterase